MSTAISDVIDAMVVRMEAALPYAEEWARLPNPYRIELNPETMLRQGWAVAVSEGTNSKKLLSNHLTQIRNFKVLIAREALHDDSDPLALTNVAKDLQEDMRTVVGALEFQALDSDGRQQVSFVQDSGPQYMAGEERAFMFIEGTFAVFIQEQVS